MPAATRAFLDEYNDGAILDEIQQVPDLLSYIQGEVDSNPVPWAIHPDRLAAFQPVAVDLPIACRALRHTRTAASRPGGVDGITHNTARAWLSILETSYIIHRLPAWHGNIRKQIVKAPKLHFFDSGLVCYLLGIHEPDQLRDLWRRALTTKINCAAGVLASWRDTPGVLDEHNDNK